MTTPRTASTNSSPITRVLRRATCWCSKKVAAAATRARLELYLRSLALLCRLGRLQQLGLTEAEHPGKDRIGERFALGVVFHHRIVERLARERDLVLGAGELFLDREHVLVRFQIRVPLGQREQLAEHPGQLALGLREALHRRWIAG